MPEECAMPTIAVVGEVVASCFSVSFEVLYFEFVFFLWFEMKCIL